MMGENRTPLLTVGGAQPSAIERWQSEDGNRIREAVL
jgi:hypothetical protein